MRRCSLILIIAEVAAWSIVSGPAIAAQPVPQTRSPRDLATQVKELIGKNAENAENAEFVTFADRGEHSVRVVRGKRASPGRAAARGADEIATFSNKQIRADAEVVSFANRREQPVTVLRGGPVEPIDPDQASVARNPYLDLFAAARGADLDRVAFAVDGAELTHGADPAMWRAELGGPQGPMQVSAAAAVDLGGGDRFDLTQNRRLGRAYLALLYRRYGDWPDAVAAYNWGPGNLDSWVGQGRPAAGLPLEVERYCHRVLRDGGIPQAPGSLLSRTGWELPTP